jgi:transcriptional regulator GlxA family with amidase domain
MQRIGFIVLPGFQMMSVGVLAVFEFANKEMGEPVYDLHLLSEAGGLIRSAIGVDVVTEPLSDTSFDTVIVGGSALPGALTPGVIKFLRRAVRRCRRVAATCTGAFVLAEAGLLDGRRATTHWNAARELQARFPKVKVEEDRIFIVDGPVWTSAGMTAGIDLVLAMIEKDLGADVARAAARKLVVYHRRAGGQSQFSAARAGAKSDRIRGAGLCQTQPPKTAPTVGQLAAAARPVRANSAAPSAPRPAIAGPAVGSLRLEAARLIMERSRHPIRVSPGRQACRSATVCATPSCAPSGGRRGSSGETRGRRGWPEPWATALDAG